MITTKLFEVKFKDRKLKIYESKTLEHTFYDVKVFLRFMFFWVDYGIFVKNLKGETRYNFLRFETYKKMIGYVFK